MSEIWGKISILNYLEKRWGRRSAGLQRPWMLYSHLPENEKEIGKKEGTEIK